MELEHSKWEIHNIKANFPESYLHVSDCFINNEVVTGISAEP